MRFALLTLLVPCLAQAAGAWSRLYSAEASATSFLRNNWNKYQENYHPSYALDDDPKTAWVEGADGDGVGESLRIPLSSLDSARTVRLVIFNGYQKSPALLAANAAPKQLTVTVRGLAGNSTASQQLTLEKKMGPQSFDIPVEGSVAEVVLSIDKVHPGTKYRDTCISDVQVFVDSNMRYKAGTERAKHKALLNWKRARLADALYYAALPNSYPFASTHFAETYEPQEEIALRYVLPPKAQRTVASALLLGNEALEKNNGYVPLMDAVRAGKLPASVSAGDQALLRELEGMVRAGPTSQAGTWHAVSLKERIVLPENFSVEPPMREALYLSKSAFFEAKGPGALVLKNTVDDYEREARSNVLLLEGSAADPRKVYFFFKSVIADRSSTTTTTHVLALFEQGRLSRMVSQSALRTDSDFIGNESTVNVVLPTYTDGKLSRLEIQSVKEQEGVDEETPAEFVGTFSQKKTLTAETRS
ncbi:NADase-type glycan-binding domain-containing protein [Melittangium boletus]|uniref:NADase-type glycan-binding domain-containing protein n=1 Tax=Melittangium boletus TaxID=83453 RepID=UPI003DA6A00B